MVIHIESRSTTIAATHTKKGGTKIGQFLNSYSWTPQKVWFDKIECAIHGYGYG